MQQRLETHNKGSVTSTKSKRPWKLIFAETYISQDDALRREKYLKTTQGKNAIKHMLRETLKLAYDYFVITEANNIDVLRGKTSQFKNFNVRYNEETLHYLKTHLADEDSLYLIAKEGDVFAGFCSVDSDWWEVNYFSCGKFLWNPCFSKEASDWS
ncbi:MAG: GIY-YIG nuclease family protein [Patescibacteria group bacterium]